MADDLREPAVTAQVKSWYTILEPVAKGCVAAAALCYALGLMVKNLYLAQWATFSASLLQVEYVLSGALFIFIMLLGLTFWSCSLGIRQRVRLERNQRAARMADYDRINRKGRWKTTIVVVLGGAGVAIFLGFVYDLSVADIYGSKRVIDYLGALVVTFLVFPALLFFAWRPIGDVWHNRALGRPVPPGETAMKVVFRSTLLLAVILIYVRVIYPKVSPVYGGGRQTAIQLRLSEEGARILRGNRVPPVNGDDRTFEAELVFEDGTYFMLLVHPKNDPRPLAIRIRRDQVSSIVTHGSKLHDWF